MDIVHENPQRMLGEKQVEKYGKNLSILVKLLDAAERLVIQVHPTVSLVINYLYPLIQRKLDGYRTKIN